MAHDAPSTPGPSSARQVSLVFGFIADPLEWPHAGYQALIVRLEGNGKKAPDIMRQLYDHSVPVVKAAVKPKKDR